VAAYSRSRWASGLARWWQASFGRNAYARGPDTVRSGRKSHRFFQHLIETDDEGANDASRRDHHTPPTLEAPPSHRG
jgi:hypothetical protein